MKKYIQKYSPQLNGLVIPPQAITEDTNVLYVIDMQKDFIDEPFPGSTGPDIPGGKIGSFAVNQGGTMIKKLITYLDENYTKFNKIIFTRDLHDPEHCSFLAQEGTFPPHCVIGTPGSHFHDKIQNWIKEKTDDLNVTGDDVQGLDKKIQIVFKGMHPHKDSFAGVALHDDHDAVRQIGPTCNGSPSTGCSSFKGSKLYNGNPLEFDNPDLNKKTWADICKKFSKEQYKVAGDNYYVCGLAGDFCVRDTALALRDNNENSNVYVLHDLTRNAFVPFAYPLLTSEFNESNRYGKKEPDSNGQGQIKLKARHLNVEKNGFADIVTSSRVQTDSPDKGLQYYVFEMNGPESYKVLSKDEVANLKEIKDNHFHFITDLRQILFDYKNGKVKMISDEYFAISLGGGSRKKKKLTSKKKSQKK